MTSFAFRETPVQVPTWLMGIIEKYVPAEQRAHAIHDAAAHAKARRPLTVRQHEIYQFLVSHLAEEGIMPSCQEIAQVFGFRSLATVVEHLQNLERKGWITRRSKEARAITLVEVPE